MKDPLHIAVVGCGIAGASFALLARRLGHQVDLYEQTQHVGPAGAGVLLQPSGQQILANMGLLDAVTKNAEIIREIHVVTHCGKELVRLAYADGSPGKFAFGLHRGDLFTVLHSALDSAGVQLHLGIEMRTCAQQTGNRATLIDQNKTAHGPFDLIVIADGGKSRFRESSGIPYKCHEYCHGALWAVGRCNEIHNKLWQVARSTRRLCGLLPMGQNRCSLFWGLHKNEYQQLCQSSAWANWQNQVLSLAPGAAEILSTLHPPDGLTFTTFRHVTMSKWTQNQMIFIGDAAHATSPHLGQGVNLALIDAQTLAAALERQPTIPTALAAYTKTRRKQLRYYSTLTRLLTPFFQSDSSLHALGRNLTLPHMHRVPPLRRLMLKTLSGEMCLRSAPG